MVTWWTLDIWWDRWWSGTLECGHAEKREPMLVVAWPIWVTYTHDHKARPKAVTFIPRFHWTCTSLYYDIFASNFVIEAIFINLVTLHNKLLMKKSCALISSFITIKGQNGISIDVSGIIEKLNVYVTLTIRPRAMKIKQAFWFVHILIKTVSSSLLGRRFSLLHHVY